MYLLFIVFKVLTKFIVVMPAFHFSISICHSFMRLLSHSFLCPLVVFLSVVLFEDAASWTLGGIFTRVPCESWVSSAFMSAPYAFSLPNDHCDHVSFHCPILVPGLPEHTHRQAHCLNGLLGIHISSVGSLSWLLEWGYVLLSCHKAHWPVPAGWKGQWMVCPLTLMPTLL